MPLDIAAEAFRAFDRWCAEHDPDGTMDVLEAAAAYSIWASTNSIEPYLDDRTALPRPERSIRKPRRVGNINFVWGDARTVRRPTAQPIVFAIAQTPCTHTAVSGARDFETKGGYMLVDAIVLFEAARQVCEWSGAPYMMENPVTMLSSIPHIGKPNYYFNPADYTGFELGDNYTKKTSIWAGNGFVMPDPCMAAGLGKPDNRIHYASPGDDRADIRAAAPMGFARAVFQANAPHLKLRAVA